LAENAADVAMPEAFVAAVVTPPPNAPLAELLGVLKVTVAPRIGLEFESLTTTTSGAANAVLTWVLWFPPLTPAIVGGPVATGALTVTLAVVTAILAPLAWIAVDPYETPVTGTFTFVAPGPMTTVDGTVATLGLDELTLSVTPEEGAASGMNR
jgi:hypothetical protein